MAPKATGQVITRAGAYLARLRTGPGKREAFKLPTCTTEEQAEARKDVMVSLVAKLTAAGRADFIPTALRKAAALVDERLPALVTLVDGLCAGTERLKGEAPLAGAESLQTFAERWTSGELARLHPDHIREKKSAPGDVYRLEKHVYPVVGHVTLEAFKLEDAEAVMRSLPPELSPGTRRQVAQSLHRLFKLAVYPCRLLAHSPLPAGFLPPVRGRKAGSFLYPAEDAALLACRAVPLATRLLYGILAREGMRAEEGAALRWTDLDLERGIITLDNHKTADQSGARTWALDPGTAEALRRWRKLRPAAELVCCKKSGKPVVIDKLALRLRGHLRRAGVAREELHERSGSRMRMRAHDLRSTFVSLSLAMGKSEAWCMDRTGHTTSQMLNRYRRAARMAAELGLGWLAPLHTAIPELAVGSGTASGTEGGGAGEGSQAAVATSQPVQAAGRAGVPGRDRTCDREIRKRVPAATGGHDRPLAAGIGTPPGDPARPLGPPGARSGPPSARSALRVALADAVRAAVLAGDVATVEALVDRLRALDKRPATGVVDLDSRRPKRGRS